MITKFRVKDIETPEQVNKKLKQKLAENTAEIANKSMQNPKVRI